MAHGGNVWSETKTRGLSAGELLDFSADLNPLGPPPELTQILQEGLSRIRWYPEPMYEDFRQAAAFFEGVDPENILPGNGTAELIHLISRWQARVSRSRKGRYRAAVCVPAFTEYERAVTLDKGERILLNIFPAQGSPPFFSRQYFAKQFPFRGARIVFLCNPNNPTGSLWPKEELLRLALACQQADVHLVVDEAYMDLVEDPLRYSVVAWVKRFSRLIVLRSMTKSFAIPGLRVGYLVASRETVRRVRAFQPPWSMNALAAFVGERLLKAKGYLEESRKAVSLFKADLWEGLRAIRWLSPFPSCANFFLLELQDPRLPNHRLANLLKRQGILIRTCDDFTGLALGRFLRVAVRAFEENRRLLLALKGVF